MYALDNAPGFVACTGISPAVRQLLERVCAHAHTTKNVLLQTVNQKQWKALLVPEYIATLDQI